MKPSMGYSGAWEQDRQLAGRGNERDAECSERPAAAAVTGSFPEEV